MATDLGVRRLAAIIIVLAVLGLSSQVAFGQYLFNRADFSTASGPRSVAAGDFNGDSRPDLAVADSFDDQVSILLGQPNGTYASPVNYTTGTFPAWIATGDFNADGKLDLVTADENGSTVSVFLGNGDGTFQSQQAYGTGFVPFSVIIADFNGDNKLDLATVNVSADTVSILLGNGNGTFQAHQDFAVGITPLALVAADFNGDHNLDLAVVNASSNTVSILLGNGNGTFQSQQTFATGLSPQAVVAGDFNGDGIIDVAVANENDWTVSLLLGNGNGTFGTQTTFVTDQNPQALIAADFNSDGKLDLATANPTFGTSSVLLGNGNGTFQPFVNYGASFGAQAVATTDANGDGKLDLVVVNNGADSVSVLLGNGDGTFAPRKDHATGEVLASKEDASPRGLAVADFNNDGKMDWATSNELISTASVALGNGDGTFQTQRNFATGTDAIAVVTTDFNTDGIPDLAVADNASAQLSVLLGNGDGTFQSARNFSLGAQAQPTSVAVGDFDADGHPDVAVADENSNNVAIMLGTGTGSFGPATFLIPGTHPTGLTVADLNNDGNLDIIVANNLGNSVTVFLGKGDGTFQTAKTFGAGDGPTEVATADFNGDGNLDVAVSTSLGFQVSVLLGNGDGTLQSPMFMSSNGGPTDVITGDFNLDGKADIAVSIGNCIDVTCIPSQGGIAVFLGNGDGSFQPQLLYSSSRVLAHANVGNGQFEDVLASADFNGDHIPDLAVANEGDNTVTVLLSSPVIAIYPPLTNFGSVNIGSSSNPATITVSNPGISPLTISAVQTSGDFSQTSSCLTTLDAGSSCQISVTFRPSSPGTRTGTVTLTDNGLGGSQTASLSGSGNGTGAAVTFSPTSLTFPLQLANTSSAPQTVTLTNTGNQALTVSRVTTNGNFVQTNNCTSVVAGGTCTISVSFRPNTSGTLTGTLQVSDSAGGSPQKVTLSGTATFVQVSPSSLTFATQTVLTPSKAQTITITNKAARASLTINSISITGNDADDFRQTTTCGSTLAAGASCRISVTFEPGVGGSRTANVTISDNDLASPQTISLAGAGTTLAFVPSTLTFPTTSVGTSSLPQTFTILNKGTGTVIFSPLVIVGADPGDFSMTTTCEQNLFAGRTCAVTVTFTPTQTGTRTADVSVEDDAGGSPQLVPLKGVGD